MSIKKPKAIQPTESVILQGMRTLEKVELLEGINNTAETIKLPEYVSLRRCKETGRYHVISNLFPGFMKTQELIDYLKSEVGALAQRFKNI